MDQKYDVVVHIGAPKTGSSAIQYFMLNNRELLEKHGYYYPAHAVDDNNVSGGHADISTLLVNNNVESAKCVFDYFLRQARVRGLILLISAEGLYQYSKSFSSLTAGLRVGVIVFFRDPLESVVSNYNQLIKRGYGTGTLEEYCRGIIDKANPQYFSGKVIHDWIGSYGKDCVTVLPYDPVMFREIRIERMMLEALGIIGAEHAGFILTEAAVNPSYSSSATELKRLLNTVLNRSAHAVNHEIDLALQRFSERNPESARPVVEQISLQTHQDLTSLFAESNRSMLELVRHARKGWLCSEAEAGGRGQAVCMYSMAYVTEMAFKDRPGLRSYIEVCLQKRLTKTVLTSDDVRLCDAVGLELPRPRRPVFGEPWMNVILSESTGKLVLFQAVALLLEDLGRFDDALAVVNHARVHHPRMATLQVMQDRLLDLTQPRAEHGSSAPPAVVPKPVHRRTL